MTSVTPLADWIVITPVLLALMGAGLCLMLRRNEALVALAVVALIVLCDLALLWRVLGDGPVSMTMGNWLPPFGISFVADAMGASFALAGALVTLVVLVYAIGQRGGEDEGDNFFPLALLLLGGVSGAFLTGDLFNLYVWFEVMLIAAFGLFVLRGTRAELDGAVKYGFLNVLATALFLLALGLLYGLLGTLNMADIARLAPSANPAALAGIAALLLLAFGAKAGTFPVNAWLPASYHTPPAAISALFAGLLSKVGVYALLRVLVALLPAMRELFEPILLVLAVLTMLIAPLGAIAETNLRRAMGFFVLGGIGVAMAGLVLADADGLAGASLYVLHAMATMTGLYLVVGLVEKLTGTTDKRQMGGVLGASSLLSVLFLVLMLGAAGVPPFLGFWPKLLLVQAGLGQGGGDAFGPVLVAAMLLNALLTLIAGSRIWAHVFWRPGPEGPYSEMSNPNLVELSRRERLGSLSAVALLTGLVALAGIWPDPLLAVARAAGLGLLDVPVYIEVTGLGEAP